MRCYSYNNISSFVNIIFFYVLYNVIKYDNRLPLFELDFQLDFGRY